LPFTRMDIIAECKILSIQLQNVWLNPKFYLVYCVFMLSFVLSGSAIVDEVKYSIVYISIHKTCHCYRWLLVWCGFYSFCSCNCLFGFMLTLVIECDFDLNCKFILDI
jgi:hypothetical protein